MIVRSADGEMYTLQFASKYEYETQQVGIEVPVELRSGLESTRLRAKIDTGAAFCIFQRQYAELLEIEVESGELQIFTTVNGDFRTYGHVVEIVCLGRTTEATVYFAASPDFTRNVLGRAGWLNMHRLAIFDHDMTLYLSHYNDQPSGHDLSDG